MAVGPFQRGAFQPFPAFQQERGGPVAGHGSGRTLHELEQRLFSAFDSQEFANPELVTRPKPAEPMDVTNVFNAPTNATSPPIERRYDAEIMAILWMLM